MGFNRRVCGGSCPIRFASPIVRARRSFKGRPRYLPPHPVRLPPEGPLMLRHLNPALRLLPLIFLTAINAKSALAQNAKEPAPVNLAAVLEGKAALWQATPAFTAKADHALADSEGRPMLVVGPSGLDLTTRDSDRSRYRNSRGAAVHVAERCRHQRPHFRGLQEVDRSPRRSADNRAVDPRGPALFAKSLLERGALARAEREPKRCLLCEEHAPRSAHLARNDPSPRRTGSQRRIYRWASAGSPFVTSCARTPFRFISTIVSSAMGGTRSSTPPGFSVCGCTTTCNSRR